MSTICSCRRICTRSLGILSCNGYAGSGGEKSRPLCADLPVPKRSTIHAADAGVRAGAVDSSRELRAVAACFGSVSGASRYDRSWPRLRARHTTVILAVPLGVLGALGALWLSGLANDVYAQRFDAEAASHSRS